MAMIFRPDLAIRTREGTSPPTPAMQDISACRSRSRRIATRFAICAALEQPEHEYTIGMLRLSAVMRQRRDRRECHGSRDSPGRRPLQSGSPAQEFPSLKRGRSFYHAVDVVTLTLVKTPTIASAKLYKCSIRIRDLKANGPPLVRLGAYDENTLPRRCRCRICPASENRERGASPRRAQRCEGDWRDRCHWRQPGRCPFRMNPSQKTGLWGMARPRGR